MFSQRVGAPQTESIHRSVVLSELGLGDTATFPWTVSTVLPGSELGNNICEEG